MKCRPIIFSGPMVRAILGGRKTQTRRVVVPQPTQSAGVAANSTYLSVTEPGADCAKSVGCKWCPGDRLWVKETWKIDGWTDDGEPFIKYRADDAVLLREPDTDEAALKVVDTWADLSTQENLAVDGLARDRRWRSPRFMFGFMSRITLEVVDVRPERVQEISYGEVIDEGIVSTPGAGVGAQGMYECGVRREVATIKRFAGLWDQINAKRGYSWASNPWVWAITFKIVSMDRDEVREKRYRNGAETVVENAP